MENSRFSRVSGSPEETADLGSALAERLVPGSVVALRGGIGAGKTVFAKGIARGLGVSEPVTSPTYPIIAEYEGRLPLYHIDAYRLKDDADFSGIGGEELLFGSGVSVIEWSERLPQSIPDTAITVEIALLEDGRRSIQIRGTNAPVTSPQEKAKEKNQQEKETQREKTQQEETQREKKQPDRAQRTEW
jgi:tRNA threonylcarbamoyladenosine biosynthesis protein TsaE